MSDWQAGDIALCVRPIQEYWEGSMSGFEVKAGKPYTVSRVTQGKTKKGLLLQDGPSKNPLGWAAINFVKVTPPEADEFDKETIELYNKKGKPVDAKPKRIATTV